MTDDTPPQVGDGRFESSAGPAMSENPTDESADEHTGDADPRTAAMAQQVDDGGEITSTRRQMLGALGAGGLADDAERLHDEAADAEEEQRPDEGVVLEGGVFAPQTLVAFGVAAVDGHADADDEQEAQRVHHERVREVEVADEKGLAGEPPVDVDVDHPRFALRQAVRQLSPRRAAVG